MLISKNKTNFFIKILLFVMICIVLDRVIGGICDYLLEHVKGGFGAKNNYVMHHTSEDLLIFGSSRANHHYVPSILKDSLGVSVYNCGHDGTGIIYEYGILKAITARYYPKYIIMDVFSSFDILKSGDNARFLDDLKPYYDIRGISSLIHDLDPNARTKFFSRSFQYNSKIMSLIKDNIDGTRIDFDNGYVPLYGEINYEKKEIISENRIEVDSVKLYYFKKFLDECNGRIKVIAVISPWYGASNSGNFESIKQICRKKNVPVLDFYADSFFVMNQNLFADPSHLNAQGAELYTQKIAGYVKNIGNKVR
jgi:hypothetical protein